MGVCPKHVLARLLGLQGHLDWRREEPGARKPTQGLAVALVPAGDDEARTRLWEERREEGRLTGHQLMDLPARK